LPVLSELMQLSASHTDTIQLPPYETVMNKIKQQEFHWKQ